MIEILGLSGYARSGKDTVADCLVAEYGYTKLSFAQPMKQSLEKLDPIIDVDGHYMHLATAVHLIGWENLKAISTEIRPLLQRMGTEVGREMFGANFWVEQAIKQIPNGAKVVFADVRYPNEADAIRQLGGTIWRIQRNGCQAANEHTSEHALDTYTFDQTITNNETIEQLCKKVTQLVY